MIWSHPVTKFDDYDKFIFRQQTCGACKKKIELVIEYNDELVCILLTMWLKKFSTECINKIYESLIFKIFIFIICIQFDYKSHYCTVVRKFILKFIVLHGKDKYLFPIFEFFQKTNGGIFDVFDWDNIEL